MEQSKALPKNPTADFQRDPLSFLRKWAVRGAETPNDQTPIKLVRYIAEVEPDGSVQFLIDPQGLEFYYLGWAFDTATTGQLGKVAKYFYTGPFSGCTFAVDKNWYTPTVTHVNKNAGNQGMDPLGMRSMVDHSMSHCRSSIPWSKQGPNITLVETANREKTEDYEDESHIFGFRGFGGWSFYQQTVRKGAGIAIRELKQLKNWF